MTQAWLVRAGKLGEQWDVDLTHNVVAIGWREIGDLTPTRNRQDVGDAVQAVYPSEIPRRRASWIGQLHRFRHLISKDDLVLTPLRQSNTVAVGRVAGDYAYRTDLPQGSRHTRPIEWLTTDLARTSFGQDLLYSLGSLLTVAEIARNDAVRRITQIVENGQDPGAGDAVEADAEPLAIDLERLGYDRINNHIARRFSGHGMAKLIEGILRAQGMTTLLSPPGADGGIDLLAGSGPLGMDPPRICVQVKYTNGPADAAVVRELEGVMNRVHADQALLVSWNGLTRVAEREVRQQYFRVRTWTADDVLRELTAVYDRLPDDIQIELPLKQVWMLAADEAD